MGDEEKLPKDSEEDKPVTDNTTDEIKKEETENNITETKKQEDSTTNIEKKEDINEKTKTDNLRKVIKVDKDEQKTEKKDEDILEGTNREALEQKRAILQSIKDFDFQIKKNQEEINALNQKLDAVSKDLDDLVSLYEIVSEQMNPFVGLSKVTKKRIEALENFTKEVEELKTRIGDLEAFAEMAGANLNEIRKNRSPISTGEETDTTNETIEETTPPIPTQNETWTADNIETIIEKALDSIAFENQVDNLIDEFIENLKDMNTN